MREVGLLALYLASATSDYMTGQTILLDCGMSP
jgi:enoyl-[acyl-carrier-protein] reductase (NADH)